MQAFSTERVVVPATPPPAKLSRFGRLKSMVPLALAMVVPVSIVLSFVGVKSSVMAYGTQVTVPVTVVDPYDPCRGSYLALSYEAPGLENVQAKQTVYVVYSNKKGEYQAVSSSTTKPAVNGSDFFLKGELEYAGSKVVTYPFSKAYFDSTQDKGKELASANRVDTTLSVDKSTGEAVMLSMKVDPKDAGRATVD